MKTIYNIPLSSNFLDNLIYFIFQKIKNSHNSLSNENFRVFLPNQLSCFEFHKKIKKFFNNNDNNKIKLPNIYSISEEIFVDEYQMTTLVMNILTKNNQLHNNSVENLYNLTKIIVEVIREFMLNNINFSSDDLHVPENLIEYWKYYKIILEEVLYNQTISNFIKNFKTRLNIFINSVSTDYVVAAGIIAYNYYTLKFLQQIHTSNNGIIILHGLEQQNTENYAVSQKLLHELNIPKNNIINISDKIIIDSCTKTADKTQINNSHENFLGTEQIASVYEHMTSPIQFATFNNIFEESLAVAIAIRHAIYNKQSVAVICNDKLLTEKILLQLTRWNINSNLPEQIILSTQDRILFYNLLDMLDHEFETGYTLKFFKMFPKFQNCIQTIELILRKIGFINSTIWDVFEYLFEYQNQLIYFNSTIIETLGSQATILNYKNLLHKDNNNYRELYYCINSIHANYLKNFSRSKKNPLKEWMNLCILLLKNFDENIFSKFKELSEYITKNLNFSYPVDFNEFSALCRNYAISKYTMNFYQFKHNVILSTLHEAQLIDANLIIIAGANSDNYDISIENDAWMTHQMLNQLNNNFYLQKSEYQKCILERLLYQKNILITRSQMICGELQTPIKFLKKLLSNRKIEQAEWLKKMVHAELSAVNPTKIIFCAPKPPSISRPVKFSSTSIKLLHDNPYSFYAKYILQLQELNQLNKINNLRGNFIHKILEDFIKHNEAKTDLQTLVQTAQNVLQKMHLKESDFGLWFFRLPRFFKFVIRNLNKTNKNFAEITGKINFKISSGKMICITSKADRIDIDPNHYASIIDYKTGSVPSIKEVKNFDAPQLLVEALIYTNGGYNIPFITEQKVKSLVFWSLNEPELGGKIIQITNSPQEIENLIQLAIIKLKTMLTAYNVDEIAYEFNLDYTYDKQYAHLARKKEWSDA